MSRRSRLPTLPARSPLASILVHLLSTGAQRTQPGPRRGEAAASEPGGGDEGVQRVQAGEERPGGADRAAEEGDGEGAPDADQARGTVRWQRGRRRGRRQERRDKSRLVIVRWTEARRNDAQGFGESGRWSGEWGRVFVEERVDIIGFNDSEYKVDFILLRGMLF